jgi:hypothetical protein
MSEIRKKTEEIRARVRSAGGYQRFIDRGLSYHWIQKFACGAIKNPTINNVAKLEDRLNEIESSND